MAVVSESKTGSSQDSRLRIEISWERNSKKIESSGVALGGEEFIGRIVLPLIIDVSSPIVTSDDNDRAVFKSF